MRYVSRTLTFVHVQSKLIEALDFWSLTTIQSTEPRAGTMRYIQKKSSKRQTITLLAFYAPVTWETAF